MTDQIEDQPTRVRAASVEPAEGGYQLRLTTTTGVGLDFLLDDVSIALLSFTAGFAVREAAARLKSGGEKDVRVFPKEEIK
jgi:hypothetical protein